MRYIIYGRPLKCDNLIRQMFFVQNLMSDYWNWWESTTVHKWFEFINSMAGMSIAYSIRYWVRLSHYWFVYQNGKKIFEHSAEPERLHFSIKTFSITPNQHFWFPSFFFSRLQPYSGNGVDYRLKYFQCNFH